FDPDDPYSAVSKLIDHSSSSPAQNVSKLASSLFDVRNLFANLPNLFRLTQPAFAASTPYDYGFPAYGFSVAEMNDPRWENPYQNAAKVAKLLDHNYDGGNAGDPDGSVDFIARAHHCFDITIFRNQDGDWDISNDGMANPYDHADADGKD